ncbi:MAG: imidazolonepropionase [Alphaproteobacteria bacterium]|nr:imidazolonepropionase [Alphaproteobacteria bacterium]
MLVDHLWTNARLATMAGPHAYGLLQGGAVAAKDGKIAWVGPAADAPEAAEITDCEGRLITPGLVDCHTHLVYAGNRIGEWEMRLNGASYEELARAGGGIVSTVKGVRGASEEQLVSETLPRLDGLIGEGVTTIEIKSGYGLSTEDEAKMLKAARQLPGQRDITVKTSFLGAHAMPPEQSDKDAYIEDVCQNQLPHAAEQGLADAVDGFCEGIAFSAEQMERVFKAAAEHGLPVKLHAEQLSNLGGAAMAAKYGALSADHLEYLDEAGVMAMAEAGTVAVLLPGAFYFIKETQAPPVALLRKHQVPIAVATDCNPGSSPLNSLLMTMNMTCTLFELTPEEALAGATREGARALGLHDEAGTLEVGKWCDLAIWNVEEPAALAYAMGFNPLHSRVWHGHV